MTTDTMDVGKDSNNDHGKITTTFGEITFNSKFDSGNLDRVEECHSDTPGKLCFNLWTAPDCAGTQYENGNRSWFYYSVTLQETTTNRSFHTIKMSIMNLNKQMRLYQQGLTPLIKISPGRSGWERMRDRPTCEMGDEGMVLTFEYSPPEGRHQRHVVYFAFCFPYSYAECQRYLNKLDKKMSSNSSLVTPTDDTVYYHRQLLCYSLDGLRVDLLTISSHHNITMETEPRLPGLYPDTSTQCAKAFRNKKVVFISSRVHPGETPSSYVFNGFLDFILSPDDTRAKALRQNFVFKMVPMINPDGVQRGHYRTDSRGVNLNRVYINPEWNIHPSVFCIRSLIMYHHLGVVTPRHDYDSNPPTCDCASLHQQIDGESNNTFNKMLNDYERGNVAVYVDLHAHATKRGCFMYGNHFATDSEHAECMLLPKLVSLNSVHFDFSHCVFTERNMCAPDKREDKDIVGKEGSGRVAIYKATGLLHSYTLECNYNSGARLNGLTPASMDGGRATPPSEPSVIPYRYVPSHYAEVGRGLAIAILDLYQLNPWSRLYSTPYSSLSGLRQSLLQTVQENREAASSEQTKPRRTISKLPSSSNSNSTNVSASTATVTPLLHLDNVTRDNKSLVNGTLGGMAITLRNNTQRKSNTGNRQINSDRLIRGHTSPSLLVRPQSHRFIYSSSYPYMMNSPSAGDFKHISDIKDLTRTIRLPTVPITNRHPVQHTLFRAIKKHASTPRQGNLLNKFTIVGRKVKSPDLYTTKSFTSHEKDDDGLEFNDNKTTKIEQLKTTPIRKMKKSSPSHNSKGKQKKSHSSIVRGSVILTRTKSRKSYPLSPTHTPLKAPPINSMGASAGKKS